MSEFPNNSVPPESRLYRLLECASEGFCEVDAQEQCTYINASGARILGQQAAVIIGTSLSAAIHPHRSDGQLTTPAECRICQALHLRVPQREIETVFWNNEGVAIPVSCTVEPEPYADGAGTLITFSDISERRRLENELRQRTAELVESECRKTEFIATLAHELRNPLAPIRAALQMMRKASDNAASMAQMRDMMERQLEHLVHLVNDLLDVARVTSGQMRLTTERVALQDILGLAVEASASVMTSSKNTLALDIPEEPILLQVDTTRLTQVFTNILNNATQYSAAGSPISLRVEIGDQDVRIDIADAGVGIAREALNRIFDLFTRVGREARGTHAGLGIGLNLARRWVEMHGGQLVATSEGLGKGSHFIVTLPLPGSAPMQLTATRNERPVVDTRGAIRALIVDDNLDAAVSLSLLLQLGGHTTVVARDGLEGLRVAAEFKPDIVMLDIGLPGMDGYDVARALRRIPELGNLVLVAVTGWGGPEDRLRSKEAGFDEHLTKPVDISTIELILATLPARRSQSGDGSPPVENGDTIHTPG